MVTEIKLDLSKFDAKEFSRFIFDREVTSSDPNEQEPWYWDSEFDYDPVHHVDMFIDIFKNSKRYTSGYTDDQLEQGFWAIISSNLQGNLRELIWDERVDINRRIQLIESMYDLYRDFFSTNALDTSCNMWWDSLCYDFTVGNKQRNEETIPIQDSMFTALVKILELESEDCQFAALHGLGHLQHPDTEKVISKYIDEHQELSEEDVEYALDCITGNIM